MPSDKPRRNGSSLTGTSVAVTLLATLLTLVVASAYNIVGVTGHGLELRMTESTTLHAEPGDPVPDEPADQPIDDRPIDDQPVDDRPAADEASHAA